jgi:Spy/CpxP family protein refolding chaperone
LPYGYPCIFTAIIVYLIKSLKRNSMKTVLKSSFVSAIIMIMAVLALNAQPGYGPGPGKGGKHGGGPGYGYPDSCRVQLMVDDMKKALTLSDEQVAEIENIHFTHIQEVKAIDEKYKNDCVGARDARWALRDKMDADVKAVLDDEQKAKYDTFMDERRGPHGRHQKHRN